ncbi:MAG: Arm DNA-binding domain-containing protein [Gammaproteobacteria bacterium]
MNCRFLGRERRCTIGSYPDWPAAAARKEAETLKRRIDVGQDPIAERR